MPYERIKKEPAKAEEMSDRGSLNGTFAQEHGIREGRNVRCICTAGDAASCGFHFRSTRAAKWMFHPGASPNPSPSEDPGRGEYLVSSVQMPCAWAISQWLEVIGGLWRGHS